MKLSVNKIEGETRYTYDDECNLLPNAVQDYYGLSSRGGKYGNTSLIIQNDENHKTFKEIADIIETEPAGLIEN